LYDGKWLFAHERCFLIDTMPKGRVWGLETLATLRQACLLPCDLGPVVPDGCREGDDVVVLIHGFFATAGVFRPLRSRLANETGARVASFTHAPGQTVRSIARALARLVDAIPHQARVHIVGHSLGGIVARWYVQELGGHGRVAQTISLASPFGGAPVARRFPILVGADLREGSSTLARLRRDPHAHRVPHTSIVASDDHLVVPQTSGAFHHGDVLVMQGRSHNSLLFDREVADVVAQRVLAVSGAAPARKVPPPPESQTVLTALGDRAGALPRTGLARTA
jgi:pimeloyl-ACP methyl ester carboxylesterase